MKVFENAFESYFNEGSRGYDLKVKAMSQYINWADQEWEKPHDYSAIELPFHRSTL